ncbi:DNA (cytosine-5)-methyltransferase 1B [Citrus sinensis]|nr:DNA (cytosine-5)-methyltransferase 1B [Citrus sinensis]
MASTRVDLEKFNGDNDFYLWSLKMRAILIQQGLDSALDDEEDLMAKKEKVEGSSSFGADQRIINNKAHSTIILHLSDEVLREVSKERTATGLWAKLEEMFLKKSLAKRLYMKRRLYTFSMKDGVAMKDHVDEFNKLILVLENVNIILEDKDRALILLSSLPESYEHFVDILLYGRQILSLKDVKDALESKDLKKRSEVKDQTNAEGLVAKGKPERKHNKQKKNNNQKDKAKKKKKKRKCYFCQKKGHYIKDCFEKKKLEELQKKSNGKAVVASEDEGDYDEADVLVAAERHPTGKIVMKGVRKNGLYILVGSSLGHGISASVVRDKTKLWHMRLAHISERGLRELSNQGLLGDDKVTSLKFCEKCVFGKATRLKFSLGRKETKQTLDYIHSDLWGPSQVPSLGGARYFVSFIDDFSRKVWIYVLKHKNEALGKFKEWITLIENQTEKKIKRLRTDNGMEYCSKEFEDFYKSKGIARHRAVTYTPQQNGLAERMNRTIIERVRYMLLNANLSKGFWAEAVTTAAYLINRSPSSALGFKTPQELWSGKPPDLTNLRIFGCPAYAHIKQGKLEPKAVKGDVTFDEEKMLQSKVETEIEATETEEQESARQKVEHSDSCKTSEQPSDQSKERKNPSELETYQLARDRERRAIKMPMKYGIANLISYALTLEGFIEKGSEDKVCLLKKSLYGLKQSPRQWYLKFDEFMISHGYCRSKFDNCVYYKLLSSGGGIYLLLYVDDMLIACNQKEEIKKLKVELSTEFEMKDLGAATKILGMQIIRDRESKVLYLSQADYVKKVLTKFNMEDSKPVSTHLSAHFQLSKSLEPTTDDDFNYMREIPYSSAVGSIMYAMVCTRLDLALGVGVIKVVKEAIWLRGLVSELGFKQEVVIVGCDSLSAIQLSKNPKYHERTKHIDVRMHFIRDEINKGVVNVVKVPFEVNPADMLTKPLPSVSEGRGINRLELRWRFVKPNCNPSSSCSIKLLPLLAFTTVDVGSFVELNHSSSVAENVGGKPVYLSAIQEWMIEFGYSFVSISVRTDISWYRLGRPSKQYAAWYKPVLKTVRLAIALITMLNNQSRASRLSFADVIKKVSKFSKTNPAYISSNPTEVERYVVVHGHIILQQFADLPNKRISKCAFVSGLFEKMEERHHTRSLVKKKVVLKKEINSNLRASKNKVMQATTTRLIKRIWEEFYSNYLPEDTKEAYIHEVKVDEELDEEHGENSEEYPEDIKVEQMQVDKNMEKFCFSAKSVKPPCSSKATKWDGELIRKTCFGESLYKRAIVCGNVVNVGGCVLVETADSDHLPSIYFVEFMFEKSDSRKMVHGRHMLRGSETFLGNTADANEVFLTNDCLEIELEDVKEVVAVEILLIPWGHQHRKTNACKDKIVRERAEDQRIDQFPLEYYCKSLYWPERGTEFHVHDYVYVAHHHFADKGRNRDAFRNEGMKAYVVCQLVGIEVPETSTKACPESTEVKVRRFFRPEDISEEKAYYSDIREVYYSKLVFTVPVTGVEGKCDIRKKHDLAPSDSPTIFEHIFFCEHLYDPDKGTIKQLPPHIETSVLKESVADDTACRKINGKCKEEKHDGAVDKQTDALHKNRLATLDIFAGCGGLSDGLQQAGVSITNWAIEYEQPAGEAFKVNHPEALVFINNCNVILRAIMSACGDADDCISTPEASELAAELDEETIKSLPRPGQVDFISGGPPCQGFSGMNRFNQGSWSKVQCEMILASLSFADYFRPRFFLLENVRNFTSFNKGQTFRLTLASLLQMGYQVRFGVLQAGAYGMSQSRKRAFIWAASPEETLPEWPEPMHVFTGPELKVKLARNSHYAAVRSTANGAPFRAITVRDTIGDLPAVGNGASVTTMEVGFSSPVCDAHFIFIVVPSTKDMLVLNDHISKAMSELNLIRCQKIPKQPGSDWRVLPSEKVRLSNGQVVDLIPWCLPNTAEKHNQWKGLFGRLDWEGNFPTSVTDPHPMGMVGTCFHPDQDRIITVRECARSQIGNAVPPPLAFALGRKLKEAVEMKASTSQRYSCVL